MPPFARGVRRFVLAAAAVVGCLTVPARAPAQPPAAADAVVRGRVRDAEGRPVAGALVTLPAVERRAYTDARGDFRLSALRAGAYRARVTRLGFAPVELELRAAAPAGDTVEVVLARAAVPLSEVVVAPGRFGLLDETTSAAQTMSRREVETMPQFGEDLLRSLHRLPGLSASDFSARFRVRGGAPEELLVRLDGLELVEPYHLKDFDGVLSILDVESVGGVELLTGGFGAAYGNRLTGVLDLTSVTPAAGDARASVGVSFSNLRAKAQGTFADGRGQWLVSARRGYLDLLLQLIGEENPPSPRYEDLFAKVHYRLGARHALSLDLLQAGDRLTFDDPEPDEGGTWVESRYGNVYGWGTLRSQWRDALSSVTLLSASRLRWDRVGADTSLFFGTRALDALIDDGRRLTTTRLKQDWSATLTPRVTLTWGGELRHDAASYAYRQTDWVPSLGADGRGVRADSGTAFDLERPGTSGAAYLSLRFRPLPRLTTEAGVRHDHQSWTSEGETSPRLGAALELRPGTTLRAAWGTYAQPQAVHELQVYDGDGAFHRAERAEHRVVGLEHALGAGVLGGGVRARVELYERRLSRLRPRWLNVDNDIEVFGEVEDDRVRVAPSRARVRGAELFVQRDGERVTWSASYALAEGVDVIGGVRVPRPFDQRHSVGLTGALAPSRAWRVSAAWTFRTGWPYTPPEFAARPMADGGVFVARSNAAYNTARLPAYHRLDLRAMRTFDTRRGGVSVFGDLFNAYARDNVRGYSYDLSTPGGRLDVGRVAETYLPLLPSVGAAWEFR